MNKNFLQDVVPPAGKKTVRNIPLPEHKQSEQHRHIHPESMDEIKPKRTRVEDVYQQNNSYEDHEDRHDHDDGNFSDSPRKRVRGKKKYWILLGILVVVFLLMSLMGKAEVNIYPKTASATVDASVSLLSEASTEGIPFESVEVTDSQSQSIKATGESEISQKAKGTIIVFNAYSDTAQRLINNTRFQTPDGLIFRIQESITVPGRVDGRPGSIEVQVVADQAGEDYNIDLADFTIPGFRGLPQFDNFYARSKTPMTGGFVGIKKIVSEEDMLSAQETLNASVRESLIDKAKSQFEGDSVILYNPDDIKLSISESDDGDDNVSVTVNGSLNVIMIDKKSLSSYLAQEVLVNYKLSEPVIIENLDLLEKGLVTDEDEDLVVIKGLANFKWLTDIDSLKEDLAGKSQSEVNSIVVAYPSIHKTEAVIRPFWKSKFPKNAEKIEIVEIKE